jgi:hypothetical protein
MRKQFLPSYSNNRFCSWSVAHLDSKFLSSVPVNAVAKADGEYAEFLLMVGTLRIGIICRMKLLYAYILSRCGVKFDIF